MRKTAVIAVPLAVVIALAGCSPLDLFTTRAEAHFADSVEFAEEAEPGLRSGVVPDDATAIDAVYHTDRPGTMIAYTSATGPAECVAGTLTGAPNLESTWWPSTEPDEGMVCGDWQVFTIDTRWYAWTS